MMKQVVLDILDYLRWQVENDRCMHEELRGLHSMLIEHIGVDATAEDLGRFYSQKTANVKNVINRNPMPKPKRKVYHNFVAFMRFVPKTWRRGKAAE